MSQESVQKQIDELRQRLDKQDQRLDNHARIMVTMYALIRARIETLWEVIEQFVIRRDPSAWIAAVEKGRFELDASDQMESELLPELPNDGLRIRTEVRKRSAQGYAEFDSDIQRQLRDMGERE